MRERLEGAREFVICNVNVNVNVNVNSTHFGINGVSTPPYIFANAWPTS